MVTRGALLAQRALERTDQVERVVGDNHVLVLRAGELALAHLVELTKQGPSVGGIARGAGRADMIQSGGDGGGDSVCFTLVKRYRH